VWRSLARQARFREKSLRSEQHACRKGAEIETRKKREERREKRKAPHLKTVARPTSNYLSGLETAGLLLISPCLNRLALEA